MGEDTKNTDDPKSESPKLGNRDSDSKESYEFINQVIKEKPKNRKKILTRIACTVAAGLAIGGIAAVTFVFAVPAIRSAAGIEDRSGKIIIPSDEDPNSVISESAEEVYTDSTETVQSGSASDSTDDADGSGTVSDSTDSTDGNGTASGSTGTSADSTETSADGTTSGTGDGSGTDADVTPTPSETSDPEQNTGTTAEEEKRISVLDYKQLYQDMLDVAEETQQSLVEVAGITSEMDYFNQNYVNTTKITGVIVASNGTDIFILTEYRIVENVERVQVTFQNGTMADATFQKQDPNTGLCVLKVPIASLSTLTRQSIVVAPLGNSYTVVKGEPVLALGSPMGYSDSVAFGTVTSVSNKVSLYDHEYNLLTTDIEGSSSGSGVLVNLGGQVVGFINQKMGSEDSSTITGLAISQIKELIQSLSNNETVPYVGIRGQNVTQDIADRTGIPVGLLVTEVAEDSPAMLAGLKEYDVITEISGNSVTTFKEYHNLLKQRNSGEVITITAMRKGAEGYAVVKFSVAVSAR